MEIKGKVALITGASEGIGAACAKVFQERGARLSLLARSEEKLRAAGGAGAVITAGDLTDERVRKAAAAATIERFGSLDILINNAGVGYYGPSWQAPIPEVRRMVELNLMAPLEMIQLVAPLMAARGGGCIVNVGSIAGKVTFPWMTLYSVTKYALGSLTDGLRLELRAQGIHTLAVCPGYVRTGFGRHVLGGTLPETIQRRRMFAISAEECAEAIARGVERGSRTVVVPRVGWLLVAFARLFPSILDWQLSRIYRSV